jgi:putative transposase
MKVKRYTTEEKIRILRDAGGGKNIVKLCGKKNISEQTFHRWKRKFGMTEIPEARRRKELEKRNSELKEMLAGSLLKNRVLEIVNARQ